MHCPNCGSHNIQLRHVGKKAGGVIGATAGGLAALEGAAAGALIGSVIPVVGTIAGGLIGFLSGACAGAVTGSLAGEHLDGTVFDEYCCTQCEHSPGAVSFARSTGIARIIPSQNRQLMHLLMNETGTSPCFIWHDSPQDGRMLTVFIAWPKPFTITRWSACWSAVSVTMSRSPTA